MTAVTLENVWVNDAADPSQWVTVPAVSMPDAWDTGADVRTYAGGRQRLVKSEGTATSIQIGLQLVDAPTLAWLQPRIAAASPVIVRDPFGLRRCGVLTKPTITPYSFGAVYDVTVTLLGVSYPEGV